MLIETDEAVAGGDQVTDHCQASESGFFRDRDLPLLGAVGAGKQIDAAILKILYAGVREPSDGFIDTVEVNEQTFAERAFRERDGVGEIWLTWNGCQQRRCK